MALITLQITSLVASILAIIFGFLIIKYPKTIAYLVGAYLIIIGGLGLLGYFI